MSRIVTFDELGGPDVLRIVDAEVGRPPSGHVRMRVEAIGVNRADIMLRNGTYAFLPALPGARLGCEAAGVVEYVGTGVDQFAVGDPVLTAVVTEIDRNGTYADHLLLAPDSLLPRPPGDAVAAAAMWVAYSTAYGALVERGRVRPADTVLITAASSSVGLAAIQIANLVGAVPIAVTTSRAKRERLIAAGAAAVVVDDGTGSVSRAVRAEVGRGVDVVLDAVVGPGLAILARAAKRDGVVVVYGWLDTRPALLPMNWPLTIIGYNDFYDLADPAARRRAWAFLNSGLRSGALVPHIDRVFALDDVVAAHRYVEAGGQFGKVVLTT